MADQKIAKLLAVLLAVQLLVMGYEFLSARNENEIARTQAEVERLEKERDSIAGEVAENREVLETLRETRAAKDEEIDVLRSRVFELEAERLASQLTVRGIRKTTDLQARLERTFPEMANSSWGVTTIPLEPGDTLGLEYFVVPVWFTETFIIDHLNAESWRQQKDELLAVDSLRVLVSGLQDSVATLHERNALALQTGYDNASTTCRDISSRYVAELRKPRFSIGSTVGLCVGAAGAGALIATLVNR